VRGDLRTPTGRNFVDVSVALGCREHLDAIAMFRFRRKRAFTHDSAMPAKKNRSGAMDLKDMYRDFLSKNEAQLDAIGLPKQLRPVVFHKLLNDIDDANAAFCARRVGDDFSVVSRDGVSLQPYGDAFVGSFVRFDSACR
jgi:hypothetical protein